jgi:hypothetical protein
MVGQKPIDQIPQHRLLVVEIEIHGFPTPAPWTIFPRWSKSVTGAHIKAP